MNDEPHSLPPSSFPLLSFLLRLGAFLCFVGWGWVHFYWEGPYTELLWHDRTWELAESLGIGWEEFVGTGANDGIVQAWIARLWWLYLACAILTLTVRSRSWLQQAALLGGSGLLILLSYAKFLNAQEQLPMFVEHGGQFLMPVILVLAVRLGAAHRATIVFAVVAVIMTFAGHGSYALAWWPPPTSFSAMTSVILGVEYETSCLLLRIAGVLDFAVCLGLLFPALRRTSALYASFWGFVTALARPMAGMSTSLLYFGADQFVHEAVLRAPHFLIPLYLFFVWKKAKDADESE